MDRRKFLGSAAFGLGGIGLSGLSGLGLGGLGGLGLGLTPSPARAQTHDFAGRIVELIIPFKEGGGSDTWGRFNAPFLSRYLPGQPTVVVRNVPGGNSIAGANRFAARARPDGLSVLGTSASTQFPYLMDDPRGALRVSGLARADGLRHGRGGLCFRRSRYRRRDGTRPGRRSGNALRQPGTHVAGSGSCARLQAHGPQRPAHLRG